MKEVRCCCLLLLLNCNVPKRSFTDKQRMAMEDFCSESCVTEVNVSKSTGLYSIWPVTTRSPGERCNQGLRRMRMHCTAF